MSKLSMPSDISWLGLFLWISVFAWGIGLGAKLFDLIVVAGAWSAAPPHSLARLPYGPDFRINPGHFFLPVSAMIATGAFGALIVGWNTPSQYRLWLWLSALLIVGVWLVTAPIMWPMNTALYAASREGSGANPAEAIRMAHRWVRYDWLRVSMIAAGFVSAIRAISAPVPR